MKTASSFLSHLFTELSSSQEQRFQTHTHTVFAMAETKRNDAGSMDNDAAKDPKGNIIQVSNTKKPLSFYLNLAKRQLKIHDEVELSALGMAIPTAVMISEILKRNRFAVEKSISISTVATKDVNRGWRVQKARMEIVLIKQSETNAEACSEKG